LKILVTGGAGFLGSNLVDSLLSLGHHVAVVDNLQTGRVSNLSLAMKSHRFLGFVKEDVINLGSHIDPSTSLIFNTKWDVIYNFACAASPPAYQADPIHTMKTCTLGTLNMLEIAKENGSVFIQASTSEIYGDPEVSPQKESYKGSVNTVGPRSCYDEGKRAAETLCRDYRETYGLPTKIVRIFNTYGPRMDVDDGRVVTNFVKQALLGQQMTIYGDGLQTRSFCYVDDLIDGFVKLLGTDLSYMGPVNLGNPIEFTIMELAFLIADKLKLQGTLFQKNPLPQDDPKQRKPDISEAMRVLGWYPNVKIADGLDKIISYIKSELTDQKRI
jgi:UDP-glucuronate decarboxylase